MFAKTSPSWRIIWLVRPSLHLNECVCNCLIFVLIFLCFLSFPPPIFVLTRYLVYASQNSRCLYKHLKLKKNIKKETMVIFWCAGLSYQQCVYQSYQDVILSSCWDFFNIWKCQRGSLLLVKTRFPRRLRCKEEEEGGVVAEAWRKMLFNIQRRIVFLNLPMRGGLWGDGRDAAPPQTPPSPPPGAAAYRGPLLVNTFEAKSISFCHKLPNISHKYIFESR